MASGSFQKIGYQGYTLKVAWTSTPTISSNSSTITFNLSLYCPYALDIYGRTCTVEIDGKKYTATSPAIYTSYGGTFTLCSITTDAIAHNTDGSKAVAATVTFPMNARISGTMVYNIVASNTLTLDNIARAATITSAPNFNDTENPTIQISNPAGSAVENLEVCITLVGNNDDIKYRAISKTASSYTFNLTTDERNLLINNTLTSNSRSVGFYLRTTLGGVYHYSKIWKTFTVVNGSVWISPSTYDSNATTVALTGNSGELIRYYSTCEASVGAVLRKNATLKSQYIKNGNTTYTTGSVSIKNISSGSFTFSATDSRGNTDSMTVTANLIPYIKLSCDLDSKAPDTDGNMTVSFSGNYWSGNFGAVNNTLTVQYRYRVKGGTYGSWTAATASINSSSGTYTATADITGLDYKTTYEFQARAIDKLATVNSNTQSLKATPVFDWGEGDFKINVPLQVEYGRVYGRHILYDSGTTGTVTLSDSLANYDYVEIHFRDNNNRGSGMVTLFEPKAGVAKTVDLSLIEASSAGYTYIRRTAYICKDTTLTPNTTSAGYVWIKNDGSVVNDTGTNYIQIIKVFGYK